MNWSIHKTLNDAQKTIKHQMAITKSKKSSQIVSEKIVAVEFEKKDTQAKKIVYELTGIKSALVGMSGGKRLTVYYIAEQVRGKYISCTLSFWNDDEINPATKLPPLLEEVMTLKE